MKKTHIIISFISIFFLSISIVSCSKDFANEDTLQKQNILVDWNTVFETSRAVVNTDGSGYFENGDSILVYAGDMETGNSRRYIIYMENGRWLPDVYWNEVGNDVRFTAWFLNSGAFFDKIEQSDNDYLHIISDNQNDGGYEESDLLCAQVRARLGEKVNLYFKHTLSRMNVILESRDMSYSDNELRQAEVEIYTPCNVAYNLSDGTLMKFSDYKWVKAMQKEDNVRTALLCPVVTEALGSEGWIRITIDGHSSTVKVPENIDGIPFERLEEGKQINYRLNLRRDNTTDEFAGTTRWVYGVNSESPGEWNSDKSQLLWTGICGWFDCNKINPSGISSADDGLMCWAASASNLIHWWLHQNADTEAVKNYNGPSAIPVDMLHSEIFQLYKNNFTNRGEYPIKALNWFFNGVFQRKIYDTDPVDSKAAFFRSQLGTRSLGMEYAGTDMMCERFNNLIKEALSQHKGILFVINLGKNWSTHAVTLWGVRFGDDGLVDTLYMVDNNDGRYDKRGTVRAMKVKYLPYPSGSQSLYPYVPNSLGDFTIRIESLCTLSLGRELIN